MAAQQKFFGKPANHVLKSYANKKELENDIAY